MSFIRRKENFICGHCGTEVQGNGYTNHCPECLWSRHVDEEPGDRAATCQGLMRPMAVEWHPEAAIITHRCEVCGHTKRNKTTEGDSREALLAIVREQNRLKTTQ
jgi:uncharacterized CHY-type Zn-finger protein